MMIGDIEVSGEQSLEISRIQELIGAIEHFLLSHSPTIIERSLLTSRFVILSILLTLTAEDKMALIGLLSEFDSARNNGRFQTMLNTCTESIKADSGMPDELRYLPNIIGEILQSDIQDTLSPITVAKTHKLAMWDGIKILA
jgi:hypothetical protein